MLKHLGTMGLAAVFAANVASAAGLPPSGHYAAEILVTSASRDCFFRETQVISGVAEFNSATRVMTLTVPVPRSGTMYLAQQVYQFAAGDAFLHGTLEVTVVGPGVDTPNRRGDFTALIERKLGTSYLVAVTWEEEFPWSCVATYQAALTPL